MKKSPLNAKEEETKETGGQQNRGGNGTEQKTQLRKSVNEEGEKKKGKKQGDVGAEKCLKKKSGLKTFILTRKVKVKLLLEPTGGLGKGTFRGGKMGGLCWHKPLGGTQELWGNEIRGKRGQKPRGKTARL